MERCLLERSRVPSGADPRRYFLQSIRLLFLLLFIMISGSLLAQIRTVTGRVTAGDSTLSGVSVVVKGTTTATQTDEAGRFSISAPVNATLVFSSVGYEAQE